MFERILLPLDGSDDWEKLLPQLEILASSPTSEVIVLEAIPFVETLLEMPKAFSGMDLGTGGDTDIAERYVTSVVEILESRGIHARGITQVGSDVDTITRVAHRQRATLVALALRDPAGFPWSRLRRQAEQVLMSCPTPTYAVPSHRESTLAQLAPGGAVLIPVDGTGLSLQVIPPAAEFCQRVASTMLFVHILGRKESEAGADDMLAKAKRQAAQAGIPADTFLGRGDPAEEILKCCSERNVSMIAMRGRLAPNEKGGSLGKVMVQILRETPVPLLMVRRPYRMQQSPAARSASPTRPETPAR